jgi:ADP-dependent NAD(P)H-hydrate dehydratase / NAD(P)H-hydrate epimerase
MVGALANALAAAQAKGNDAPMGFELVLDEGGTIQRPRLTPPPRDAHKYARGSAMVVSGPPLRTGASRLTAQAALAVGAGLVTILGTSGALAEHAAHISAIMLREQDEAFTAIDDRVRALAIGPGAGISGDLVEDIATLLLRYIPIVLDADALSAFEAKPEMLFAMLHDGTVLTPHAGEFARLFPDLSLSDRANAAKQAANRAGATVLLKGPQTIIAAPDGKSAINLHSAPWLATAGSGDVLTGLICGLLAQGSPPFDAACIATWLHGDMGVLGGPGLTADTMLSHLPLVLRGCLAE